jgi:hypothetical protein
MPTRTSIRISMLLAALLLAAAGPSTVNAAVAVECGQLTGYTAPDPGGPTPGSLSLGITPDTWVIDANAVVSPAAAGALASLVNTGPTCVSIDTDTGGVIVALDFAASGVVSGDVTFDGGSGFYVLDDRIIVPQDPIIDLYPGLAALFPTSAAAGTPLSITFTVDPTMGNLTAFDGTAAFCGAGSLGAGGVGNVGDATIPAEVLDDDDRDALTEADGDEVCANVRSQGNVDTQTGNLTIVTAVTITGEAAPQLTPPPTDTVASSTEGVGPFALPVAFAIVAMLVAAVVATTVITRERP